MAEDNDYYSSDEDSESMGEKMPMPDEESADTSETKAEGPTATVPLSFLPEDADVGYECKIKVIRIGEDEAVIEKLPHKEKRESEPMAESMEEMESLATEDSGY